jgi:hypothetical protein
MKTFLALSLTLLATVFGAEQPSTDVRRTVYLSAVDAKGVHVTDLTPADVTVKEGGKDRAIDTLGPARALMQLSILVDDGGTGGFQGAVSQFIRATFERAEFSIRVLNPQALKVLDYTRNADELRSALGRLGPRGRILIDGEQMIAGVFDSAKEMQQRRARRPSIIAFTVTGEKTPSDQADEALNTLKSSGAGLSVVYVTGIELGKVLGDGPRHSGGLIEQVTGNSALGPAVAKIADNLLNQYELTYTLPEGVKPNEKLSLSSTRKGVKLIAPSRLPDK